MRRTGTIVGIVLIAIGGIWTLQGANLLAGSVMSGQSLWLYIGIAMLIAGLAVLWWFNLRRR